jgi:hypothetical protein
VRCRESQSSRGMEEDPNLEEVAGDMMEAVLQVARSLMTRASEEGQEELYTMMRQYGLVEVLGVQSTQTLTRKLD